MGDPTLRLLDSTREILDDELSQLYAYPDRQTTWVRANFISSIDGAATLAGRSGGLAGPGDQALFGVLRTLADIIVVGAGTVRIENYAGAHLNVAQRQRRQDRGQSEVPRLAIVTRSGHLDRDMPVFTRTEVPPLVLTCAAAAGETRDRLTGLAEVIDCSDRDPDRVDEATALAALGARGQHRVLTEGGPTLLNSFIEHRLLDELCLTVAPCVVGGGAPRIATGTGQVQTAMRCAHLLTDDAGYLYARYVKGA
ncbi:MAG TPA: pyrimidine reductase family protein [Mycobacterium sp.]|nr:pyrimidine reductase family protein [Mycobacterium sp.]